MKCPQCGKEVPDNTKFCPECGFNFANMPKDEINDPAHEVINTSTTIGSAVSDSYRDDPNFKKKVRLMNILGAIGFVFSGLGVFASSMLAFNKDNNGPNETAIYVVLLVLGVAIGLGIAFIGLIPMSKKYFPDGKAKGFLENLPGVFLGFMISFAAVALAFQGFILVIR